MNLRILLHIVFFFFVIGASHAIEIIPGTNIADANKAMQEAGYRATGLSMEAFDIGDELAFWAVDGGVLIIRYSLKTKKIAGISYWFSDGRAKAHQKTFDLDVESFDTKTAKMMIQTKKPKLREPQR